MTGQISRDQFIREYVGRAKLVGFDITQTEDGCIYAADDEDNPETRYVAEPCHCGYCEGWGMMPVLGEASS